MGRARFCNRQTYTVQRAITPKVDIPQSSFLCVARGLIVVIIFINFVRISQTVFKLYGKHDFRTDRQTDRRPWQKNKVCPGPEGGDIKRYAAPNGVLKFV